MDTPEQSKELEKRIRLVRRDMSDLLFHFTRGADGKSASSILDLILRGGKLRGTSNWSKPDKVVCFTESPIQEFNAIFSLSSIANSDHEHPRYEPYGIAVSKKWLYKQGGRPVIYDSKESQNEYSGALSYRFVPYNPECEDKDYTWEREWRIKTNELNLDPTSTLVIVPSAEEAFDIVYGFADVETGYDYDCEDYNDPSSAIITGSYDTHTPRWLAVSLDMFGFNAKAI